MGHFSPERKNKEINWRFSYARFHIFVFPPEQPYKSNQLANPLDVQRAALLTLCLQPTAKADVLLDLSNARWQK